jgi:transposase
MGMRKSRLSKEKQERLMKHFLSSQTARCAAGLVGVKKSTAAYYFHRLREIIYQPTEDEMPFSGEIEVDESCFGGVRKGKRGRVRSVKFRCSGCSNVVVRFTPK